jgi:acetate CoA/acetoacetate CoA-transferase beta subunit
MEGIRELIAKRAAKELADGMVVNLGIGIPTMVANYIPEGVDVILQSENGFVGLGPVPEAGMEIPDIVNAAGEPVTVIPGAAFFDSALSFGLIRGGHVDITILGALQVDEQGNLANWMIPGKMVPGMGGAMDLVVGSRKVIVVMEHTAKGKHKILKRCDLPLTAVGEVDMIISEIGVMEITMEGLILKEINPLYTVEQVQEATGCPLIIDPNLKSMMA